MEVFLPLLLIEILFLHWGQRHIFPRIEVRSRLLAVALSAPGTVLHEASHFLMCKLLGVQTGRVELFRPRRSEDGYQLGVVEHAVSDPLRQTLVAIAPLLLVPPFLLCLGGIMFGSGIFTDPVDTWLDAGLLLQVLSLYILLSAGSAAFPSPGDHIPVFGLVLLALLTGFAVYLIPFDDLEEAVRVLVLFLAPGSVSAMVQLGLLQLLPSPRRQPDLVIFDDEEET